MREEMLAMQRQFGKILETLIEDSPRAGVEPQSVPYLRWLTERRRNMAADPPEKPGLDSPSAEPDR
jgi:hypothetical protein